MKMDVCLLARLALEILRPSLHMKIDEEISELYVLRAPDSRDKPGFYPPSPQFTW